MTSSHDAGTSTDIVSLENPLQCSHCPRYFNSKRGLNIHKGKCHKEPSSSPPPVTTSQFPNPVQQTNFWQELSKFKRCVPILKRIPRGARVTVAQKLAETIRQTILANSRQAWENLLTFPYRYLHVTRDPLNNASLTSRIKKNCFSDIEINPNFPRHSSAKYNLIKIVEEKVSEGDIKGAARLLFSNDTIAPDCPETLIALQNKHPSKSNFISAASDDTSPPLQTSTDKVRGAVMSFPPGSAGGLDGLTPQHLKDLTSGCCGEAGEKLLLELTNLCNLMLRGEVASDVVDILYGANLCALRKRDGGIRPIAVGSTYRRLTAKIACKSITSLASYFQPKQLGFACKGGCEAAVHAFRTAIHQQGDEVFLKVDVKNAFNSVDRGAMLAQINSKAPAISHFMNQCYKDPTKLIYQNHLISSEVGCQQGDPLGPAIFSLAIHPVIETLNSKFNVWYLDDGTLGSDASTVLSDFRTLIHEFKKIGLELNLGKCELFVPDSCGDRNGIISSFKEIAPQLSVIERDSLFLLGSPILDESLPVFVNNKLQNFSETLDRLLQINCHMAFTIIRYCIFVPKLTYVLRCCQLWKFPQLLKQLDDTIRHTLSSILNINFDDRAWTQATLPIRFGGLGVRQTSDVALPAFLSSVHANKCIISKLLGVSTHILNISFADEAKNAWDIASSGSDVPSDSSSQRLWDGPICELVRNRLVNTSSSLAERARLLAVERWESGAWLQALPSAKTGTLLDRSTFRLATALRLGAPHIVPHQCVCGTHVDSLGHHGLCCQRSAGRISRHHSLNDLIRRALVTARVPAILEPTGLARDDGKRPDGMTLVPWSLGRALVWDATCVDTLAPSHVQGTSSCAGAAANQAESLKRRKYESLSGDLLFEPFGVETLGPWGPSAHKLFREISKKLIEATCDPRAGSYLAQRIAIAIQRGNAVSLLGTLPGGDDMGNFFFL